LRLQVLLADGFGILQQTVGQSAFAVVNVGNDAEISDILHSFVDNRVKYLQNYDFSATFATPLPAAQATASIHKHL
jgi:hypothetical protein